MNGTDRFKGNDIAPSDSKNPCVSRPSLPPALHENGRNRILGPVGEKRESAPIGWGRGQPRYLFVGDLRSLLGSLHACGPPVPAVRNADRTSSRSKGHGSCVAENEVHSPWCRRRTGPSCVRPSRSRKRLRQVLSAAGVLLVFHDARVRAGDAPVPGSASFRPGSVSSRAGRPARVTGPATPEGPRLRIGKPARQSTDRRQMEVIVVAMRMMIASILWQIVDTNWAFHQPHKAGDSRGICSLPAPDR